SFAERIAEDVDHEGIRTRHSYFRSVLPRNSNGFPDGSLARGGVREDISFDKEPFGTGDPAFLRVLGGEVAGNGPTCAHGSLGMGCNDTDTVSGGFIQNDGVSDVDAEFFEFAGIEEPIAVITDTTNEGGLPSEL